MSISHSKRWSNTINPRVRAATNTVFTAVKPLDHLNASTLATARSVLDMYSTRSSRLPRWWQSLFVSRICTRAAIAQASAPPADPATSSQARNPRNLSRPRKQQRATFPNPPALHFCRICYRCCCCRCCCFSSFNTHHHPFHDTSVPASLLHRPTTSLLYRTGPFATLTYCNARFISPNARSTKSPQFLPPRPVFLPATRRAITANRAEIQEGDRHPCSHHRQS
jgi:hypothetical protein